MLTSNDIEVLDAIYDCDDTLMDTIRDEKLCEYYSQANRQAIESLPLTTVETSICNFFNSNPF